MSGKWEAGWNEPTMEQLQAELKREQYNRRYTQMIISTVSVLLVVAAAAVLVSFLLLPVLRVHGTSMAPTLQPGEVVVALANQDPNPGDIVAFYYENKLLIRRCVAVGGQTVEIDENGRVTVDGQLLDEPYVTEYTLGLCDIELPCRVPDNAIFCLSDNRTEGVDSRSQVIGTVETEQLVGKILLRVWPLRSISVLE